MDKIRSIDILLFDDLNILDVAGPVQAFSSANDDGVNRYQLRYVSLDGSCVTSSCGLRLQADQVLDIKDNHDLLVPGGRGVDRMLELPELQKILSDWQSYSNDQRVISVCSGALILADAGLLDGRSATTHWGRAALVRNLFPRVRTHSQ